MSQVVILNGGSSSGKSTLARSFRDRRAEAGDFWLVLGFDDFFSRLPDEWYEFGSQVGRFSADGMQARIASDEIEVSFGPVARSLLHAYQGAVAAAARAGVRVIVDELTFDLDTWKSWGTALQGLDVVWVGVLCDHDVAESREATRGNRTPGKARLSAVFAHRHARYDFTIDTTHLTPAEAVEQLTTGLQQGARRTKLVPNEGSLVRFRRGEHRLGPQ